MPRVTPVDAQLAPPCSLGLPPITATAVSFAPEFYHPPPSSTPALLAYSDRRSFLKIDGISFDGVGNDRSLAKREREIREREKKRKERRERREKEQ